MKRVLGRILVVAMGSLGLVACGTASNAAPPDSGGAASVAGAAENGGVRSGSGGSGGVGGGEAAGAVSVTGASAGQSASGSEGQSASGSAGQSASGSAGGPVATNGGAAASDNTQGCPPWPKARVLPWVGPFFYGPDPGPCTLIFWHGTGQSVVNTVQYESGHVKTLTRDDGSIDNEFEWEGEELVRSDFGSVTYESTANELKVIDVGVPNTVTYALSPTGYPLSATLTRMDPPSVSLHVYEYENCRLVRRTENGQLELTYDYDDEGHMTARRLSNGELEIEFGYACW